MAETAPIPTAAAAETPAGETRSRARPRGPAAARAPSPQVAGRNARRGRGTRVAARPGRRNSSWGSGCPVSTPPRVCGWKPEEPCPPSPHPPPPKWGGGPEGGKAVPHLPGPLSRVGTTWHGPPTLDAAAVVIPTGRQLTAGPPRTDPQRRPRPPRAETAKGRRPRRRGRRAEQSRRRKQPPPRRSARPRPWATPIRSWGRRRRRRR